MVKILKIYTYRILENPDAHSVQDDLLDIAKEAGYTHVCDMNSNESIWDEMPIDDAIKYFRRL